MPEPGHGAPAQETTTARTESRIDDALLARLLHDLDVANDTHPADDRPTRHPDNTPGATPDGVGTGRPGDDD